MSQSPSIARPTARHDWIAACRFHDLRESEVLEEVAKRVRGVKEEAKTSSPPLVLLDLDSTLYEVEPRSQVILLEWCSSEESSPFPHVRAKISKLAREHLGYSIKDTFAALGLSIEIEEIRLAWESAKGFWLKRFFNNAYMNHDRPYPGAAEFTRELHAMGAEIVYLTGRDEPGMGDGTRANLIRDGFPWDVKGTHLLLKPKFEMDDLIHKRSAAEYIRKNGTLVASFENEPMNLVALYEIFPEAMHVFVQTIFSDRPAVPRNGLYRIQNFTRE